MGKTVNIVMTYDELSRLFGVSGHKVCTCEIKTRCCAYNAAVCLSCDVHPVSSSKDCPPPGTLSILGFFLHLTKMLKPALKSTKGNSRLSTHRWWNGSRPGGVYSAALLQNPSHWIMLFIVTSVCHRVHWASSFNAVLSPIIAFFTECTHRHVDQNDASPLLRVLPLRPC